MTVPLTDDAANAAPGQTTTAANPAARHNLFAVLGIVVSLWLQTPHSAGPEPVSRRRHVISSF
jgi:hypothetical protein